jgi:hypothetical protein
VPKSLARYVEDFMHIHIRIHHWVFWWFYVGVVGGVVAVVNILTRDLTRSQEKGFLVIGVLFWVLGGLVCYAYDGIQIDKPLPKPAHAQKPLDAGERQWHPASDFVQPGRGKSILPPKY